MGKRVAVLGGGISGVFAGIKIKELHQDYSVDIFEKNEKLLKKMYATGNGKCNYANIGSLTDKYNHEEFALKIIDQYPPKEITKYLENIGIKSKNVGDLVYPYSESALTVVNHLVNIVNQLKINIHLQCVVNDYKNGTLSTSEGPFSYDALIIAMGGKSSPQLGSNGGFFDCLANHGYLLKEMKPSLCPIKVKENTKMVDGLRAKVTMSLYQNNKLIHKEDGELLFKKDGLSGMVTFNMTHFINRLENLNGITIHVDFAKGIDGDYDSILHPTLAEYLKKNHLDIHDTVFTFKDFYGFNNSQVTSGGVSLSNINDDLSSRLEKGVYFTGEALDIDAVCGGFNIMFAFASAYVVSKNLK